MLQVTDYFTSFAPDNVTRTLDSCQRSYDDQSNYQIKRKMKSFSNIFLNKSVLIGGLVESLMNSPTSEYSIRRGLGLGGYTIGGFFALPFRLLKI